MAKRAIATLFIALEGSIAKFAGQMGKGADILDKFGTKARNIGMKMSALSVPLGAAAGSALKMAGDFEASMNAVSARGEIFGKQLSELERLALELGKSTQFSAKEAADGMAELAAAGFDATKIAASMPGVLDMAAAGQVELARASEITVATLGQFQLEASEAGRVADVMSKGANLGILSMVDLADSMRYVGPNAASLGIQLEEAAAAIVELSDAGIKGEQAGTSLRMGLLRLASTKKPVVETLAKLGVTVKDSGGKLESFNTIIKRLAASGATVTDIMNLVGVESSSAFNALVASVRKNPAALEELITKLEGAKGSAAATAAVLRQGLNGSLEQMRGSVETMGIALGKIMAPSAQVLANVVEKLADSVTELAMGFQTLPEWVQATTSSMVLLAVAVGPLTVGLGFMIQGFGAFMGIAGTAIGVLPKLATGITLVYGAVKGLAVALGIALGPVTLAYAAVGLLATAAFLLYQNWETAGPIIMRELGYIKAGFEVIFTSIRDFLLGVYDAIKTKFLEIVNGLAADAKIVGEMFVNTFNDIKTAVGGAIDYCVLKYNEMVEAVTNMVNRIKTEIQDRLVGIMESVKAPIDKVAGWFHGLYDKVVGHSYIPDMVAGIRKEMAAHEGEAMVGPAQRATDKAGQSFDALEKRVGGASKRMKGHLEAINTGINDIFDDKGVIADPLQKAIEGFITRNDVDGLRQFAAEWSTTATEAKKFRDALGEAKKATKELNADTETLAKTVERTRDGIGEAFGRKPSDQLSALATQIRNLITSGDEAGLQKLYDGFSGSTEETEKFNEALQDAKQSIAELDSVSTDWTSGFASGLGQVLQALGLSGEVANQLGQLMGSMFSRNGGSGSGGSGGWGAELGSAFRSMFGGGTMTTDQAHSEGIQGPGMKDGSFGNAGAASGGYDYGSAFAGVLQAAGSYFSGGSERDRKNKDNSEAGGAIGSAVGTAIGAYFGMPQVGAAIGQALGSTVGGFLKTGSQNAETQARHAFANFVEEQFSKLGKVAFFDAQGVLRNQDASQYNFVEGARSRFNPNSDGAGTDWAENFRAMGEETVSVFTGLGMAFKELLGITEDVAPQIGYLIATNLHGNIDNARLFVQQLGVTQEQFMKALEESAIKGNISWHEYNMSVRAVTEAYKEGLVAHGAYGQAFENLRQSGGKGMAAIKSFRDIAVEALEDGVKTMDELKARMIAEGADPAEVEALFAAAAQRGISTLEGWRDASNATAGAIVGDMYALSDSLRARWDEMKGTLEDVYTTIEKIPDEVEKRVKVKVEVDDPAGALDKLEGGESSSGTATEQPNVAAARGGVVNGASVFKHAGGLGLMGEAGPEAILPLAKVNGRLGVAAMGVGSGGTTIVVNAPYADAGAADHIENTLMNMKDAIIGEAIEAVIENSRRSGFMR